MPRLIIGFQFTNEGDLVDFGLNSTWFEKNGVAGLVFLDQI